MIKYLDLLSYCLGLIVAAAFLIIWVIVAAHSISSEDAPINRIFYFNWWLSVLVTGVVATVATGQLVKRFARDEVRTLLNSATVKQLVIYNQSCRVLQTRKFISVLTNLDSDWPTESRFIRHKYKVAIVANDTIARFDLIQNNTDSTLYRVLYLNYTSTANNGIGVIRITPPMVQPCQ